MVLQSEWVWFSAPIYGLLWQLGGTFNKLYRRIGIPALSILIAWVFLGWSYWWIALAITQFITLILPFTLRGDSVLGAKINWAWIWILGYLCGLPSLVIGVLHGLYWQPFVASLIPCLTLGIWGTLSNINATREFSLWKWVEFVVGGAVAYPICLLINKAF
jgi:hypothetical protein